MTRKTFFILVALLLTSFSAYATIFGSVRGIIHDPQHRPVENAMVMIRAKSSDWSATMNSNADGEFEFKSVAVGRYVVTVAGQGFNQTEQDVVVMSGTQPVLHFALSVAGNRETVNVQGTPETAP